MSYEYFMAIALDLAQKALLAGEFPVGCVIVSKQDVVATGARTGSNSVSGNELDHAEMIALRQLNHSISGSNLAELTIFTTLEPCLMCYGALLIAGIHKIVYAYEDAMGGATRCNLNQLSPLYKNAQINIVPHILRNESLFLFKSFFNNPDNAYLSSSYLANYTRCQSL
jgi:tRNA(adenine34) deaminase